MALILDHVNGVAMDNRLRNLRIVCPNCAATLDTHCGANVHRTPRTIDTRPCARCGMEFQPRFSRQTHCSAYCGRRAKRSREPRPSTRKVERPAYEQLVAEVRANGYSATGRRYGVSHVSIRKWLQRYEFERMQSTRIHESADQATALASDGSPPVATAEAPPGTSQRT
jgi:hypothetical protein